MRTHEASDLRASRLAMLKDSGVQGEGARSEGAAASKAPAPPSDQEKVGGLGRYERPQCEAETVRQGTSGWRKGPGHSKSGAARKSRFVGIGQVE